MDPYTLGLPSRTHASCEPRLERLHLDVRIEVLDAPSRRLELRDTHGLRAVQDLALQIGLVDDVEIDHAESPDAGRRQIERRGGPEPAGAYQQDARSLQLALPLDADVRENEMARVPQDLFVRQLGQRIGHRGPSSDARNDRDRVARRHLCLLLRQLADIPVVHVHVHEAPQPAVVPEQVLAEPAVLDRELFQHLAHAPPVELEGVLAPDERPERHGDQDGDCHATFRSSKIMGS